MSRIFFVTGTDTGVGKTIVAAALLSGWMSRYPAVRYFKPVQTGCVTGEPDDTDCVMRLTGAGPDHLAPPLYRLPLPASPDCAARHAGVTIDPALIVQSIRSLAQTSEVLVVEGAGGLLVPVAGDFTMLDLLLAVNATPVVVARTSLGTLNHTALTLRALAQAGCPAALVVANDVHPPEAGDPVRADNLSQLKAMSAPAAFFALEHVLHPNASGLKFAGNAIIVQLGGS